MNLLVSKSPRELVSEVKPIVLPIASIENHGPLPIGTDYLIANCITSRLGEDCLCAPIIPYSVAIEHRGAGFTITSSPQVFMLYLRDVLLSLTSMTTKVIVLCFHGGALHLAYVASRLVRSARPEVEILIVDFWSLVREVLSRLGIRADIAHAGFTEASILAACNEVECHEVRSQETVKTLGAVEASYILKPWIWSDKPEAYRVDRTVECSRSLGARIIEEIVQEISRLCEAMKQQNS